MTEIESSAATAGAARPDPAPSPMTSFRPAGKTAAKPAPGKQLWHDLGGFGTPGVSIDQSEIDEIVYGS